MAILRFAFEVYKYQEVDHQAPSSLPENHAHKMFVKEYIGVLVTGFLDRYGDTLPDYDALRSPLEFLGNLLALWTDACGLDFCEDLPLTWEDETEVHALVVCWCKMKENGLPLVDFLLKSGYRPHIRLVQLFVLMFLTYG
jgi:hypothetical protein